MLKKTTDFEIIKVPSLGTVEASDPFLVEILKMKNENPSMSMAELARKNNLTSRQLVKILKPIGEWRPKVGIHLHSEKNFRVFPRKFKLDLLNKICKSRNKQQPCCEVCGIESWKGYPFENIAEVDHIDGNKTKNALENLRILCPNCHSHTTTRFSSVKTTHPSKNESSIAKKNMITSEGDILITNDMQKAYRKIYGLSRRSPSNAIPLEEILKGNLPHFKTGALVNHMLFEKRRKVECECCGLKEWRNIPIGLFLHGHHVNHNTYDHRDANIEILCPNCHGTKHTFPEIQNPKFQGKKTTHVSANALEVNMDSPLVKKIAEVLDDPNRPKAMKDCAQQVGIHPKQFKKIVKRVFPDKWAPAFTGVAKK